jgi:nucleoside-diphosphate-sugar epimerase
MRHYLVTGGSGFIGLAAATALAARGDRVTVCDLAASSGLIQLATRCPLVCLKLGDITDPEVMDQCLATRPDAVLHCAAMVGVAHGARVPEALLRVNIQGSLCVLDAMRRHRVRRMIHISSEETYGDFQAELIDETHPQVPLTAYGVSKLAVEQLGRAYRNLHNIETINLRTCWVYGPGLPRPRVPKNLLEAAVNGTALHLPGGAGFCVDHTYIEDTVDGIIRALDLPEHPFDAYNLASGTATSVACIVGIIRDLVPDADISVAEAPYDLTLGAGARAVSVRKGALDISRAGRAFGYKPRFSMRDGLDAWFATLRATQSQ